MKAIVRTVMTFTAMLLLSYACFAQDVVLSGVSVKKGTQDRIAEVQVSNLRTKRTVKSNSIGMFQIMAIVGDTLGIAMYGYLGQEVVVRNNKDLIVLLVPELNMLKEVTVHGETKKSQLKDIARDFKRSGSFFAGKPPLVLLSPFGGSPITFFYELFGKTPRQAKRFHRYQQSELDQMEVDQYFNPELILKNSDLRGAELEEFLIKYRPNAQQVKKWSSYDAIQYIKSAYKSYADTKEKSNLFQ